VEITYAISNISLIYPSFDGRSAATASSSDGPNAGAARSTGMSAREDAAIAAGFTGST
jgi:hypothetical protein